MEAHHRFAWSRLHHECGLSALEDEKTAGDLVLGKENTVLVAGDGRGTLYQSMNQLLIGCEYIFFMRGPLSTPLK